MADSFLAQKLVDFTDPGHMEPSCHRPFSVMVEGQEWSVACAGAWLFAVRGSSSHGPLEKVPDMLTRLLQMSPVGGVEVSAQALKDWTGPLHRAREFPLDGSELHVGSVLGRDVDCRRLAQLLEPVPFPRLTLWDSSDVMGVPSIGIESRGKWRGFLAGVNADPAMVRRTFSPEPVSKPTAVSGQVTGPVTSPVTGTPEMSSFDLMLLLPQE